MTTIAIVIVNYNTCDHLRRCLELICPEDACPEDASEIVVVDNASTDGSAQMVRKRFPQVTLYARATNIGYGAGANQAVARCEADYFLLLNSDTLLQPGSARALQKYLDEHPRAAVVGPRLHNSDGSLQPSCYPHPTPFNLLLEESLAGRLLARIPLLRGRYLRSWPHDKARIVPWVLGAALAVRREAFVAVGGFDPEFFMYFEEIDLCHRLAAAGWENHFAPVTTIVHAGGASTSQQYAAMQYRLFHSTQLFYRRHYHRWQLRLLQLALAPILAARLARDALRHPGKRGPDARAKSLATIQVRYRMLRECLLMR